MIRLIRCDDRLIHGQCMISVTKEYNIDRIIVVDDFTATNAILRNVFEKAVNSRIKATCVTVEQSVNEIEKAKTNDENTLILMKTPQVFVELRKRVGSLPDELNIGPMSNRKGTKRVALWCNLLPSEIEAVRQLVENGVHVYFRQVMNNKQIEWSDVKDKL